MIAAGGKKVLGIKQDAIYSCTQERLRGPILCRMFTLKFSQLNSLNVRSFSFSSRFYFLFQCVHEYIGKWKYEEEEETKNKRDSRLFLQGSVVFSVKCGFRTSN